MLEIRSEIGRLRQVLTHAPGLEVDRMVPSMMEELLFDDILFGDAAREEHESFLRVLEHLGVEVLQAQAMLGEALAEPPARDWIMAALAEDLPTGVRQQLSDAQPEDLASMLVHGIRSDPKRRGIDAGELFEIVPLPNYCFQRDPQIALGNGVIISSMAMPTRWRESLLSRLLFKFHPRLSDTHVILDPLQVENGQPMYLGLTRPTFEGGDVLVLSPEVIAVGHSERTNRSGIRRLARALFHREGGPRWMVVVSVPQQRAYMHLDTIFTPVDNNACLVHEPVILGGHVSPAPAYVIDLHGADVRPRTADDFLTTLRQRGVDLEPISCGGDDLLHQEREQWTDGANALALAPGVITLYDRNQVTAESLDKRGFKVVTAAELLAGKAHVDLDDPQRICILLPSYEMSRARGGPHCLTHALVRDSL